MFTNGACADATSAEDDGARRFPYLDLGALAPSPGQALDEMQADVDLKGSPDGRRRPNGSADGRISLGGRRPDGSPDAGSLSPERGTPGSPGSPDLESEHGLLGLVPNSEPKAGIGLGSGGGGAVTSSFSAVQEGLPAVLQALGGLWLNAPSGEPPMVQSIVGDHIIWPDGSVSQLMLERYGTFVTHVGDHTRRATLVDDDHLIWADGEVWMRSMPSKGLPSFTLLTLADAEDMTSTAHTADDDQLGLRVPSDDEGRPKPPYPARVAQTALWDEFMQEGELAPMTKQAIQEEEEWLARKRLTGAVGRLVRYMEDEKPSDDVLGLRISRHGRIMVTALNLDGNAAKCGVSTGDQLASINGRHVYAVGSTNAILANVRPPVTLVFLGFAGKLQAEVRVRQPDQPKCGMNPATEIVYHNRTVLLPMRLTEAIVFQQRLSSSLFIATTSHNEMGEPVFGPLSSVEPSEMDVSIVRRTGGEAGGEAGGDATSDVDADEEEPLGLYELQRDDARRMLKRVLRATLQQQNHRHELQQQLQQQNQRREEALQRLQQLPNWAPMGTSSPAPPTSPMHDNQVLCSI